MKNKAIALLVLALFLAGNTAQAYWVWSPETGKWVNPKKSAKDTPEDQLAWAKQFYDNRDWDRSIEEFEKLAIVFPASRLAAEGVYFTGMSWEEKGDLAKAADNYQKLIDKYPYSDRIKDAIGREFAIAGSFASGGKVKVLGVPALPGQEKAIELYKHIIKNAPFGTFGDQAQFQIGEVYKMQGEYEEAQKAFQAVVDDYPNSELLPKARYQIAYCSMLSSKKFQYNEQSAQRAIEEFEGFKKNYPANAASIEADESIKALREKRAATYWDTAEFYEKQSKLGSAKVYYQEVVDRFPDTTYGERAKKKVAEMVISSSQKESAPKKPWYKVWG